MFDRPQAGERALLVQVSFGRETSAAEYLSEFRELAVSAGALPLAVISGSRKRPDARTFVGSGKADEIAQQVRALDAELVLFDHLLSPAQERNLEALFQCRVLDRTGLILDIFAQRARSFEGKLQVELAQLKHLSTRLIRGWTHLERQKGGIGLRGPGETQLETDRRLLAVRIKQINGRLSKVRSQREQGRQSRRKASVPTVALVGYTNAGKSTLFNALTEASVYVEDQLFATLDPTLRSLHLENGVKLVLADTVGFIRDLPHDLVNAFQSTLQETKDATLLLHVIDASDQMREEHIENVEQVLKAIGADGTPCLKVFNKIDVDGTPAQLDEVNPDLLPQVWLSAQSGEGLELLRQVLEKRLAQERALGWLVLAPEQGRLRARLFELKAVSNERQQKNGGFLLQLDMELRDWVRLCKHESLDQEELLADLPEHLATVA
ncbi:MAG: ribosome rescue GTPase HflX [Gammaproteobacteria bacterium]|nr:ribosome rescue GTPase HflX [Gammaproteobacteria bacterium]